MKTTLNEYATLSDAAAFFNKALFDGKLPDCLITLQRKPHSRGYFSPNRFYSRKGDDQQVDEIALNPDTFHGRTDTEVLSTLAHELCHFWDEHFGHPARGSYHGKTWAAKMESIGLMPSDTGAPGGKKTGQSVTHYIIEGGKFASVCANFLEFSTGLTWNSAVAIKGEGKKSNNSKVKYSCPDCGQNAWAKPTASLMCGECEVHMEPEGM